MDYAHVLRNTTIYAIGLGLAIIGALGLANAIDLGDLIAGSVFVVGLLLIFAVHEWLDGPL